MKWLNYAFRYQYLFFAWKSSDNFFLSLVWDNVWIYSLNISNTQKHWMTIERLIKMTWNKRHFQKSKWYKNTVYLLRGTRNLYLLKTKFNLCHFHSARITTKESQDFESVFMGYVATRCIWGTVMTDSPAAAMSQCMRFLTVWHFDMCRLGWASATTF